MGIRSIFSRTFFAPKAADTASLSSPDQWLIDAMIGSATAAGGLTLLAWQTATEYDRLSPAIIALAPAIGITDPLDLDELFREAALISA